MAVTGAARGGPGSCFHKPLHTNSLKPIATRIGNEAGQVPPGSVTNALNRRLDAPQDPASAVRLFEQWIILECRCRIDYLLDEARLFTWRTGTGAEVDLLVERHGRLRLAVGTKSTATLDGADCTGLRSFHDAHPEVPCAVVSRAPEPYDLGPVHVLPCRAFLSGFSGWLK